MSLRYITGVPRSGKTYHCIRRMLDAREMASEGRYPVIYIVPEQFTMTAERMLLAAESERSGQGHGVAFSHIQVLSFQRLAFYLFSKTGAAAGTFIDDVGKTMLLRKLVYGLQRELSVYGTSGDKPGFIENLSSAINEFFRYGVKPEALSGTSNPKLSDISLIFDHYLRYIRNNYISHDEVLDLCAAKLDAENIFEHAQIYIDGFYSFTPQEERVIACLAKSGEVHLTVMLDEALNRFTNPIFTDPYFESKLTINRLTRLASEYGFALGEPVLFEPRSSQAEIAVKYAPERYAEITAVCEEILILVRDKGYRYRDIAVLAGDVSLYESVLRPMFARYDIPMFIDLKPDILSHPLTEMIRALLDMALFRRSYESMFRFLRTGFTDLGMDEIDKLENYVLAYGIKSYKWHMSEWTYGLSNENARWDFEELHRAKSHIEAVLRPVDTLLETDHKHPLKDFAAMIFELLLGLNVPDKLTEQAARLDTSKGGDMFAREYAMQYTQVWGKICHVFDRMVEIMGDESVSVKEFSTIVNAGLASMDMGLIPSTLDQVIIADLNRSRLPDIEVLLVIGANDGLLPAPPSESGLLTEDEREMLSTAGVELAPDMRRRSMADMFALRCALAKPRKQLTFFYSLSDASGKALRPAGIVNTICAGRKIDHSAVLDRGKRADAGAPARTSVADPDRLLRPRLSPDTIDRTYGQNLLMGISRLEAYRSCPFAFFMQYNLSAYRRRIYQVESVDIGNMYHDVLERFDRKLVETGEAWRVIDTERISELVDICMTDMNIVSDENAFLGSARNKYLLERIRRVAKRSIWALSEHIKRGRFEPFATEFEFSTLTGIEIDLGRDRNGKTRKLVLTGRIDRIDIFDAGNDMCYVKVIDYKSGSTRFSLEDVYLGMQLQLLTYINAFIENGKSIFGDAFKYKLMPGGVFYFNIADPIVDYTDSYTRDDARSDFLLKSFKMSGLVSADPEVVKALDINIETERQSPIIPVYMKADGTLGANSSVKTTDEYKLLLSYVKDTLAQIGKDILSGEIKPLPVKTKTGSGCDYCEYKAICGIEG